MDTVEENYDDTELLEEIYRQDKTYQSSRKKYCLIPIKDDDGDAEHLMEIAKSRGECFFATIAYSSVRT